MPWSNTPGRNLPPGWPALRRQVLRRDPICQACGDATSTDVDHIAGRDDHEPTNLQGLCRPCHAAKTQQQAAAGRSAWRARAPRRRPTPQHPGLTTVRQPTSTEGNARQR